MLWFLFVIGLALTILGSFGLAYYDYIEIMKYKFDSEILGTCFLIIGAILAGTMLIPLGINWCMGL